MILYCGNTPNFIAILTIAFFHKYDIIPPEPTLSDPIPKGGTVALSLPFRDKLQKISEWMMVPTLFSTSMMLIKWSSEFSTRLSESICIWSMAGVALILVNDLWEKRFQSLVSTLVTLLVCAIQLKLKFDSIIFILLLQTLLLFSVTVNATLFIDSRAKRKEDLRKEALQKERATQRQELVIQIAFLIRDSALAEQFLSAVERLTEYVPEEGTRLIEAMKASIGEYQFVNVLASTPNNVLSTRALARAIRIQHASHRVCEKLTEHALEVIQAKQTELAEKELGEDTAPAIEIAGLQFGHYLEGIREADQTLSGDALASAIDALAAKPRIMGEIKPMEEPPFMKETVVNFDAVRHNSASNRPLRISGIKKN